MLENETINQENAVEEFFCEPFEQTKRVPMSEEQTGIMMQLMLGGVKEIDFSSEDTPWIFRVMKNRTRAFNYEITDNRVIVMLAVLTDGRVGSAIMYLTYLQYYCKKYNIKEVDFDKLVQMFPMGFLAEEDLEKLWDGQKVKTGNQLGILESPSDNLIDYPTAYQSIL